MFKFIEKEQSSQQLNRLKYENPYLFDEILAGGEKIIKLSEQETALPELQEFIQSKKAQLKFYRIYLEQAFVGALHLRNLNIVQFFLKNGLDIGFCQDALMILTYSLQYLLSDPPVQLLHLLIKYGADINCFESKYNRTPMHLSCKYGSLQFVKILSQAGADINAIDNKRNTPLKYASQNGHKKIAEYLIQRGAVVDWKKQCQ